MFGHQTLLDCVSSPKLQTFSVYTGLHDCTRLQTKWSGFEPWSASQRCSCAKHFPDSASLHLASSRGSVSHGAAQETAREKIKKARREEARERLWENLTKGRSGFKERLTTENLKPAVMLRVSVGGLLVGGSTVC